LGVVVLLVAGGEEVLLVAGVAAGWVEPTFCDCAGGGLPFPPLASLEAFALLSIQVFNRFCSSRTRCSSRFRFSLFGDDWSFF